MIGPICVAYVLEVLVGPTSWSVTQEPWIDGLVIMALGRLPRKVAYGSILTQFTIAVVLDVVVDIGSLLHDHIHVDLHIQRVRFVHELLVELVRAEMRIYVREVEWPISVKRRASPLHRLVLQNRCGQDCRRAERLDVRQAHNRAGQIAAVVVPRIRWIESGRVTIAR